MPSALQARHDTPTNPSRSSTLTSLAARLCQTFTSVAVGLSPGHGAPPYPYPAYPYSQVFFLTAAPAVAEASRSPSPRHAVASIGADSSTRKVRLPGRSHARKRL